MYVPTTYLIIINYLPINDITSKTTYFYYFTRKVKYKDTFSNTLTIAGQGNYT